MKVWCDWLVLCSKVIQDSQSNNLTFVNCLEQISAIDFPSMHPGFGFGALLRAESPVSEDLPVEIHFVRLGGDGAKDEKVIGFNGEWRVGTQRTRVFMNFPMLRLYNPGPIRFRLDFKVGAGDWKRSQPVTVDVVKRELPAEQRKALEEAQRRLEDEMRQRAKEGESNEAILSEDDQKA